MSSSDISSRSKYDPKNPFSEPPLHKAYYYPSPPRPLDIKKKQIAMTTQGQRWEYSNESANRGQVSAEREGFLKGTNTFHKGALPAQDGSPRDNSEKFDESWPASERPSTISIPGLSPSMSEIDHQMNGTNRGAGLDSIKSRLDFDGFMLPEREGQSSGTMTGSSLSKYIERFRHGVPMSREEREKRDAAAKKQDFWWLASPPTPADSSTPISEKSESKTASVRTGKVRSGSVRSRSPPSPYKFKAGLKKNGTASQTASNYHIRSSINYWVDDQTRDLQDKADKLLEKTESTLNSSEPAVSTVGLGSSPDPSSVDEKPYRPAFTHLKDQESTLIDSQYGEKWLGSNPRPLHPDEDILHRWRLRRKMEVAKERVISKAMGYDSIRPQVDADVESKLAEFRARLAQSARGEADAFDQSVLRKSTNVQFTAAPPIDDRKIRKEVTDSKVNAEVQTSLVFSSRQKEDQGQPHMDPALQSNTKVDASTSPPSGSKQNYTNTCNTQVKDSEITMRLHSNQASVFHSPIASPSLKSKGLATNLAEDRDVEPHLHLSCDIIPCPHGDKHGHQSQGWTDVPRHYHGNSSHGEAHKDKRSSHGSHRQSRKDLNGKKGNNRGFKGYISEETQSTSEESDFEIYKKYHMKLLKKEMDYDGTEEEEELGKSQKERDMILSLKSYRQKKNGDRSKSRSSERDKKSKSASKERYHKEDIPERDIDNRAKGTKVKGSEKKEPVRTKDKDIELKISHSDSDKEKRERSREGHGRASKKGHQVSAQNKEPKRKGHDQQKNHKKQEFPKPQFWSSPKHSSTGISSAIGQVVGERLFVGASATSLVSSVQSGTSDSDSEATLEHELPAEPGSNTPESEAPQEQEHSSKSGKDAKSEPHSELETPQLPVKEQLQDLETLLASDEEEFTEDEILQDLRKRRAMYMRKLKEIDTALKEKKMVSSGQDGSIS